MKIKGSYLITVIVSFLLVLIGNRLVSGNMFSLQRGPQEVVSARVVEIQQRFKPLDELGNIIPMQGERIVFQAQITSGQNKGRQVQAVQNLTTFSGVTAKEIKPGNSVLLINFNNEWFFNGFIRTNRLLVLGLLFCLCVLIFGGRKGFNTLLSLSLTCAVIFAVFIPAILSGKNIYVMSLVVCVYTILMTLLIVIGFNKKTLTAAIGCASGLAVTGIITLVMDKVLFLTGIVDEQSRFLASLPVENQINLNAIIFAGILIGAMGAILDIAMSISSSLWEIKEKAEKISFKSLFNSGINIGRDIMGTMANTLILAYIGSSLSIVLVLSVYTNSLVSLLNSEMIIVEILQALAGSLGILFAMPFTAFFCSLIYLKRE